MRWTTAAADRPGGSYLVDEDGAAVYCRPAAADDEHDDSLLVEEHRRGAADLRAAARARHSRLDKSAHSSYGAASSSSGEGKEPTVASELTAMALVTSWRSTAKSESSLVTDQMLLHAEYFESFLQQFRMRSLERLFGLGGGCVDEARCCTVIPGRTCSRTGASWDFAALPRLPREGGRTGKERRG